MELRVWRSFSCNNSSSFRLVAHFRDDATAKDAADELTAFFAEHAQQQDELFDSNDFERPTEAAKALATKYGFEWNGMLSWGDDSQVGDEPIVMNEGRTLVIYHSYCGGFGKDLPGYFEARGAKTDPEAMDGPTVSALFALPSDPEHAAKLTRELAQVFEQTTSEMKYIEHWTVKPPWSGEDQLDGTLETEVGYFNDGKTVGFHLPIRPDHIRPLRDFLADHGVDEPTLTLCVDSDARKFRRIAEATCGACGEALTYVDPHEHGIETEQLACAKCGGMFELATFLAAPA